MEFFQSVYVGKIIYDDFADDLRFDIAVIIEMLLMNDFFFPSSNKYANRDRIFLLSEFLD